MASILENAKVHKDGYIKASYEELESGNWIIKSIKSKLEIDIFMKLSELRCEVNLAIRIKDSAETLIGIKSIEFTAIEYSSDFRHATSKSRYSLETPITFMNLPLKYTTGHVVLVISIYKNPIYSFKKIIYAHNIESEHPDIVIRRSYAATPYSSGEVFALNRRLGDSNYQEPDSILCHSSQLSKVPYFRNALRALSSVSHHSPGIGLILPIRNILSLEIILQYISENSFSDEAILSADYSVWREILVLDRCGNFNNLGDIALRFCYSFINLQNAVDLYHITDISYYRKSMQNILKFIKLNRQAINTIYGLQF